MVAERGSDPRTRSSEEDQMMTREQGHLHNSSRVPEMSPPTKRPQMEPGTSNNDDLLYPLEDSDDYPEWRCGMITRLKKLDLWGIVANLYTYEEESTVWWKQKNSQAVAAMEDSMSDYVAGITANFDRAADIWQALEIQLWDSCQPEFWEEDPFPESTEENSISSYAQVTEPTESSMTDDVDDDKCEVVLIDRSEIILDKCNGTDDGSLDDEPGMLSENKINTSAPPTCGSPQPQPSQHPPLIQRSLQTSDTVEENSKDEEVHEKSHLTTVAMGNTHIPLKLSPPLARTVSDYQSADDVDFVTHTQASVKNTTAFSDPRATKSRKIAPRSYEESEQGFALGKGAKFKTAPRRSGTTDFERGLRLGKGAKFKKEESRKETEGSERGFVLGKGAKFKKEEPRKETHNHHYAGPIWEPITSSGVYWVQWGC
jgi:hypothetical protein